MKEPMGSSSPCVGHCEIGDNGYCIGCSRTLREVTMWSKFSHVQKQQIWDQLYLREDYYEEEE